MRGCHYQNRGKEKNMRLIDADTFEVVTTKIPDGMDAESYMAGMDFVLNKIDDAPTIEPEDRCGECDAWNQYKNYPPRPHWIPCSERLPEEEEDFLVTDGESMAVGYYRQDAKAWDSADFGWIENREKGYGINEVIAWMPLPEPYRKDGD